MALITLTDPVSGTVTDATMIASNNAAILSAINGGLDNTNINSSAAIAYSKLALSGAIVNSDISAAAAIAASKLSGYPSDSTKFLRGDGTWAVPGSQGTLCTYTSAVADTVINTSSEGTANTVIAGGSFTYNGTNPVMVEFFAPRVEWTSGVDSTLVILFYRDATLLGRVTSILLAATSGSTPPIHAMYSGTGASREKPTNASHTYTVKAFCTAATTATIRANAGGTGNLTPAYLRTAYDI